MRHALLFSGFILIGSTALATPTPALQSCRSALHQGLAPLYHLPTPQPVRHALKVVAKGCAQALPSLAQAAGKASSQSRTERALTLGQAVRSLVPPASLLPGDEGSALEAFVLGNLPLFAGLSRTVAERLDAGTLLYLEVLYRALQPIPVQDDPVERFFGLLLVALQAEDDALRATYRAPAGVPHLLTWLQQSRPALNAARPPPPGSTGRALGSPIPETAPE